MRVSVIVVTMGRARLLPRCLESIAEGALSPLEVVLVDQGPGDELGESRAALSDRGIDFIRVAIAPVGVSRARNAGAAAAAGDLLAFTDDDCVPDGEWLAALVDGMQRARTQGSTGRVLPLDEGVRDVVAVASRTDERERIFQGDADAPWEIGTGGNVLLERRTFDSIGGFNPEFGPGGRFRAAEDVEFMARVIDHGAAIIYAPAAIVHHEMKPASGRMARRIPYGYGIGALIARMPPSRRARTARRYLRMQLGALASATAHLRARRVAETTLTLAGALAGSAVAARRREATASGAPGGDRSGS